MIVVRDPSRIGEELPGGDVAIGNFDGLHRGHLRVLAECSPGLERTRGLEPPSLLLTFDPHPSVVTAGREPPPRLLSDDQRNELLDELGLDGLVVLPFDERIAAMEPKEFVDGILVGGLKARTVTVGEGFRFGRHRAGDCGVLRRLMEEHGGTVRTVSPLLHAGEVVSSSRIRRTILAGDVEDAARMLGRPYVLEGRIVKGDGRGRTIGVPTANVEAPGRAIPANGVYAAWVAHGDETWEAAVNVGVRPTFTGGAGEQRVEVHVLGDPGDLLGATLRVAFMARLRDERRFTGPEELVSQIRRDIEEARAELGPDAPERIAELRGPGF